MTKEELEKEAEDKGIKYADSLEYTISKFSDEEGYCWSQVEQAYEKGALDFAEPREKRIDELEEKLANADYQLEGRDVRIAELEAQLEKMKCCGNCENGELSAHEEPCRHCQRCFASKDVTDQESVKDNWEAIKEIKEK